MIPIDESNPQIDFSVGIPEIDEEHRRFFANVNRLDGALTRRESAVAIRQLVDLLVAHAVQHFSHEEEMFGRVGFPDVEAHANIHAELTRDLALLKQNFDATVAGDEMTGAGGRIKALLVQHVLEQDMKYRDFLHQHKLVPY